MSTQDNKPIIDDYVDSVMRGGPEIGSLERAAVERYLSDLKDGHERGLHFDEEIANKAINFFPYLNHTTGEFNGEPFILRPFQAFIIWQLYGWRLADGTRRFRSLFYTVARGNGKSPFAAALGLKLAFFDDPVEARAEVYCAATKKDQAKIVFDEAYRFVDFNPDLKKLLKLFTGSIVKPQDDSTFKPIGSDSKNTDGLIPHAVIRDEVHEWRKQHQGLLDKLETALAKRVQPLDIAITTAGTDESDIWEEEHDFSAKVAQGVVQADDHLSMIFECDRKTKVDGEEVDVPFDAEEYWPQANPMLRYPNSPVKVDAIRSLARRAQESATHELKLRRYYLNQKTASFEKLIAPEMWSRGNGDLPNLKGKKCFVGFDWGWRDDLAALAMVFPVGVKDVGEGLEKPIWAIKCDVWCPSHGNRKDDLLRSPWAEWIRDEWLTVTDGNTTDIESIYKRVDEIIKEHRVIQFSLDGTNCRDFCTKLENEWRLNTFEFNQNCRKYNEPTRELLVALKEGRIINGNNPVLAWCADNVVVRYDAMEYMMPEKRKSVDKIDPIVAIIMAIEGAMFHERTAVSTYNREGRGFVIV